MRYNTPAALIRAYFELQSQLASPASLVPNGMPQTGGSTTREHVQTKLGDLALCLRGLEPHEFDVLVFRYAYAAGQHAYFRYVRSQEQIQPHEQTTGRRHPADAELIEVQGVLTRGMNRQEMAKHLGVRAWQIDQRLATAHRKVSEEMERREENGNE